MRVLEVHTSNISKSFLRTTIYRVYDGGVEVIRNVCEGDGQKCYFHTYVQNSKVPNPDGWSDFCVKRVNAPVPVSQGFRPPPPWSRPPRGQIPRDLALTARLPLGISPPPPPSQRHISENILVFRSSYQESFWNMVWQFIWQWICASQTQSQSVVWYFQKLELAS